MSSNYSINGSPLSGVDRLSAVEGAPKARSESDGAAEVVQAAGIQSISELKKLELQGEQVSLSDEQFMRAVERAIKAVEGRTTSLDFSIHQKTKQIMVKVIDKESGKIIREVPPEKSLDFLAKIWEKAGILIDERR